MYKVSRGQDSAVALLNELIQEKGYSPEDYAIFFSTGEGILLPTSFGDGELEMASGNIIDRAGRVFSWLLGWDERRGAPALIEWEQVTPEPAWANDAEYVSARHKVGLPG